MGFNPQAFDSEAFDPSAFDFGELEPQAPVFSGTIPDFTFLVDVAIAPRDLSVYFSSDSELTFSVVGTLPTGLELSSAGVLSGTPTETGETASLEVQASDGSLTQDSNSFSISVVAELLPQVIVTGLTLWRRRGRR